MVSPYYLLPAAKDMTEYEVKEGTGAMRAYQDMLYGFAKNDPIKKESIKTSRKSKNILPIGPFRPGHLLLSLPAHNRSGSRIHSVRQNHHNKILN